jgi:hypothetical protein
MNLETFYPPLHSVFLVCVCASAKEKNAVSKRTAASAYFCQKQAVKICGILAKSIRKSSGIF